MESNLGWKAIAGCMTLLLTVGCGPGDQGWLEPILATGVGIGRTDDEGDTAIITARSAEARVSGRWTTEAGQRIDISYHNRGSRPVTVNATDLQLSHEGAGEAKVEIASDATREWLGSGAIDYDHVMPLLRADVAPAEGQRAARPTLTVPAGATRKMVVNFLPFAASRQLHEGDQVDVAVPVPGGAVRLRFACRT